MHNLLSYTQLNGWRHFDDTLNELSNENDKLDAYFECLIDCDELRSSNCKRICKEILM